MKPHKSNPIVLTLVLLALSTLNPQLSASPLGTAFTYQGRLNANGSPANGVYDLQFTVCDALTNGNAVAGPLTNNATSVTNGLFTATLDFGGGVFTGPDRWLEIAVRTNGSGVFTNLSPRQPLAAVPYALYALSSPVVGTNGTIVGNSLVLGTGGSSWAIGGAANEFTISFAPTESSTKTPEFALPPWLLKMIYDVLPIQSLLEWCGVFKADSDIDANGNISANGDIYAGGAIYATNSINTWSDINANGSLYINSNIVANGNVEVNGYISTPTNIFANGDIYADGNLQANGGIYTRGHLGAEQNLDVGGDVYVQGLIYGIVYTGNTNGPAIVVKNTIPSAGGQDVLSRVVQLNISSWDSQRDAKDTASHHISPQAHEFNTAFGLGNSDKFISLVDANGVALAAIQGLNQKVEAENAELKKQLEQLKTVVATLNAKLNGGAQ